MRWLLCGVLLFLGACVPTQSTIPESLGLQVGDTLAPWDGWGWAGKCSPGNELLYVIAIRGNHVQVTRGVTYLDILGSNNTPVKTRPWINLERMANIRFCEPKG